MFTLTNDFFNIRDFLDDILILFKQQCQTKNIELKYQIDQSFPLEIFSDKKRLKQLLMNMIINSLKFTFEGHIGIYFQILEEKEEIQSTVLGATSDKKGGQESLIVDQE